MTTLDLCHVRSSAEFDFVVLGGGLAGGFFISEYVAKGGKGHDLCMVSVESVYPYTRAFLSKGFLVRGQKITDAQTDGRDQDWYEKVGITVLLNAQCTKINVEGKCIMYQVNNGLVTTLSWRKGLIVATGSVQVPFNIPGIHSQGCHKLQSYNDGLAMKHSLSSHRGGTVVVFGDQCPSMDTVTALRMTWEMEVYFLLPTDRLFPSLFDTEISYVYEVRYEEMGVHLIKNAVVQQVLQNKETGAITALELVDGVTIECDVFIYESERVPNVGLVSRQLDLHPVYKGIIVNENMRTTADTVYAVGDAAVLCVECDDEEISQKLQCVSTQFSVMMGRHLAKYLLGQQTPSNYMYFPEFNATIAEMQWRFFGVATRECSVKHKLIEPYFITVWIKDGRLQAAFIESGGNTTLETIVRHATKNQITLTAEDIDACTCIEQLVTKVFPQRTQQRLAARNQAIVSIPTLQFQIEQAMLQIQRTQQQVVQLKSELVQAVDDRKRIVWYSDQDVKDSLLRISCDTGCSSGLYVELPDEPEEDFTMPVARNPISIFSCTLLNTFIFTATQYVFYRELFVMHPFPYFTNQINTTLTFVMAGLLQLFLEAATNHPQLRRSALRHPPTVKIITLGVLFTITNVLQITAIDSLGPPNVNVTTLLNQFTLPFTALARYMLYKARYGILQVIGLALTISGVVMMMGHRGMSGDEGMSNGQYVAWSLAYVGGCVVQAGLDVLTQKMFALKGMQVTVMDVLHLLVVMSGVSVVVSPVVSCLFGVVATSDIESLVNDDYGDGAVCLFTGNTSTSLDGEGDLDWWYISQCQYASIWVVGFCLCNIIFIVVSTLVVMAVGQKSQFLSQLFSLPILNGILSCSAMMAGHTGSKDGMLWLSLTMVFLGMTLHEHELLGFRVERREEDEYLRLPHTPTSRGSPRMSIN